LGSTEYLYIMRSFSRILLGIMLLLPGYQAAAQSVSNSPFSRLGIGELNSSTSSIRSLGMGGVGVAAPNSAVINDANPALLFYNNFVTFELGVAGEAKLISNQNQRQTVGDANLAYLALSLPITRRWSTVLGLRPYSNVDYQTYSTEPVQGNPEVQVLKAYEGEGGLSEVYFGHGVKIAKGLSAGVTGSYVFGTIINDASTVLADTAGSPLSSEKTLFSTRTSYSDFMVKGGLHYRHSVKDKIFYSVGAVYGLAADIDGTRRTILQRINNSNEALLEESTLVDSIRGTAHIPQYLSVGLGIDNGKNWVAGVDFSTQNLSLLQTLEGQQDLGDSYRIGVGGELTPNMMSMDSYLSRITYRAGLTYARMPWITNGNPVTDMAVSWGASLPVGRMSAIQRSFLNLGFAVGKRGNLSDNPIRELYFRAQVGLSLNNRWFIKRMIE
jgi:hypothetical protein